MFGKRVLTRIFYSWLSFILCFVNLFLYACWCRWLLSTSNLTWQYVSYIVGTWKSGAEENACGEKGYRRLYKEELRNISSSPRAMAWAEHTISAAKSEGKRKFVIPTRRWEDNIKVIFQRNRMWMWNEYSRHTTEPNGGLSTLQQNINAIEARNFLITWVTISFSQMIMLHRIYYL
jgi:hypothetical protein